MNGMCGWIWWLVRRGTKGTPGERMCLHWLLFVSVTKQAQYFGMFEKSFT